MAVDPRNGDVVVADPPNRRVQKFDPAGAFLFAFGWGVDTGAAALETCTTASTCQAGRRRHGRRPVRHQSARRRGGGLRWVRLHGRDAAVAPVWRRRVQKFNAAATSERPFAPTHTSGTSSATAPTTLAFDSTNDHVLVAKDSQVLELDGGGGLTDTHGAGSGLPAVTGWPSTARAIGSTSRLLRHRRNRVFVLGAITPPSATIAPSTDVTATSATFNGTVNPNGGSLSTGYHFEYSDDGGLTWTSVPIPDVDVGNGTADVPVSQAVTGLEPNTDYQVRLVASRPFAGGSDTSAVDTFTTDAAPPSISGVAAREITDTTAVLSGQVDPNHSQTTYHFDYGTDTTYGSTTPVDSAGAGARKVSVSKTITGLQPSTEYHFRLVATNAAGVTEGADQSFTTDAKPPQPSGRAYEMVSPLDKNGGDIARDLPDPPPCPTRPGLPPPVTPWRYVSRANFGDLETGAALFNTPNYLARRGDDGWTTEGITPPVEGTYPGGQVQAPRVPALSLDTSTSFGVTGALLTPEAERLSGTHGLYMRSAGQPADQRYTLISAPSETLPPDTDINLAPSASTGRHSTPDGRHVVFNSTRRLLPDVRRSSRRTLQRDQPERRLRVGGRDAEAGERAAAGNIAYGARGQPGCDRGWRHIGLRGGNLHGDHLISDDGRRLFFTADTTDAADVLFVREDGAATRIVSASERPGDPPQAPRTARSGPRRARTGRWRSSRAARL